MAVLRRDARGVETGEGLVDEGADVVLRRRVRLEGVRRREQVALDVRSLGGDAVERRVGNGRFVVGERDARAGRQRLDDLARAQALAHGRAEITDCP